MHEGAKECQWVIRGPEPRESGTQELRKIRTEEKGQDMVCQWFSFSKIGAGRNP